MPIALCAKQQMCYLGSYAMPKMHVQYWYHENLDR